MIFMQGKEGVHKFVHAYRGAIKKVGNGGGGSAKNLL